MRVSLQKNIKINEALPMRQVENLLFLHSINLDTKSMILVLFKLRVLMLGDEFTNFVVFA